MICVDLDTFDRFLPSISNVARRLASSEARDERRRSAVFNP
jgi:hypothetical protein